MVQEPCDIILRGGAGARVAPLFADARDIALFTGHDITVAGNDVEVVVTPQMNEEQCREAYERALAKESYARALREQDEQERKREREREKPPQKPEPDDRAKETYSDLENEVKWAILEISRLSQDLGRWQTSLQDPHLRAIASDAGALELVARRIKRLAEGRAGEP